MMQLRYYAETDTLYIELRAAPSTESEEITSGIVADYDAEGNVVGFEIDPVAGRVELDALQVSGLENVHVRASHRPEPLVVNG